MSSPEITGVTFRDYEQGDFRRLCELDQACFEPDIAYSPEEIALALSQRRSFAIVAASGRDRSDVVGFVLASLDRTSLGHIVTIDIHAEHRRKSIGRNLMDHAEGRLSAMGARRVVLEVATENVPAISFYQARGYIHRRKLPRYYRDGSDAYLMEKAL